MSERINPTQTTKIALLIAFGFIVVLLIYSQTQGGDSTASRSELLVKSDLIESLPKDGSRMSIVGGLGGERDKDDEVQSVVDQILLEFAARSGKDYKSAEVITYRTQTVAGRNYFVKAKARTGDGKEDIVHLRIYKDLGKNLSLTAFELDKKLEEELKYFQ